MEIKWVFLLFGDFLVYFNIILYWFRDDLEYSIFEKMKWKNLKKLLSILKDFGMKIIEFLLWIFKSMKDVKVNVQIVFLKVVLQFLKLFSFSLDEKCRIE